MQSRFGLMQNKMATLAKSGPKLKRMRVGYFNW
jgi:hypothetical protein